MALHALDSEGYFDAYDAAATSKTQFAIHLGDYIYDYGAGATQFGNTDAVQFRRVTVRANDIVTLADVNDGVQARIKAECRRVACASTLSCVVEGENVESVSTERRSTIQDAWKNHGTSEFR